MTLRRALAYAARAVEDRAGALAWFEEAGDLARERGLLALALEAEVSRAQLLAEQGDLDAGLALAGRRPGPRRGGRLGHQRACRARSVEAHLHLRRDPAGSLVEVTAALDAARAAEYPAAISVNLRSLAWGRVRSGDLLGAAEALRELFDDLIARQGVADMRGALFTTAELLHPSGSPAWEPVAATALHAPVGRPDGRLRRLARHAPHAAGRSR